jgi:hypothetical protein
MLSAGCHPSSTPASPARHHPTVQFLCPKPTPSTPSSQCHRRPTSSWHLPVQRTTLTQSAPTQDLNSLPFPCAQYWLPHVHMCHPTSSRTLVQSHMHPLKTLSHPYRHSLLKMIPHPTHVPAGLHLTSLPLCPQLAETTAWVSPGLGSLQGMAFYRAQEAAIPISSLHWMLPHPPNQSAHKMPPHSTGFPCR